MKCLDIRSVVKHNLDPQNLGCNAERIEKCCNSVEEKLRDLNHGKSEGLPRVIIDSYERPPYKAYNDMDGPAEQINIRTSGGELIDIRQRSKIVRSLEVYRLKRAYYDGDDPDARTLIHDIIEEESQ